MERKIPGYLRKAYKLSRKAGWDWELRGSKHVTIRDAKGDCVCVISLTAYDGPLTKKIKSTLKKAGCPGLA